MAVLLPWLLLPATVAGVSTDGLYLDVGAAAGVHPGDAVVVGDQHLTVVEVGPHHARTGPVADVFSVRPGEAVEVTPSGPRPAAAPSAAPTRLTPAPKLDPAGAPALWAAAPDGWAEPRPFKAAAATAAEAATGPRWRVEGDVSLSTSHLVALDGTRATSLGTLGTTLDAARDGFRYRHDLRFNGGLPSDIVSEGAPYVEARQLELGWETDRWAARGGRVVTGDRWASGPVDGLAFALTAPGEALHGGGSLYGGLAPAPDTLEPRLADRTAGLSGQVGGVSGDFHWEASAGANTVARGRTIDRIVLGPEVTATSPWLTLAAFSDIDLVPALTLSALYTSAYVSFSAHADVGLRYGRAESPALGQADDGVRHDTWLDGRLDFEGAGALWPRIGYLVDPAGETWAPGVDYRVPLARALDALAGYDYSRGPWQESHQGRARLTLHLEGATLAELDLGGRAAVLYPAAGLDGDVEKTLEVGAWLLLPAGFELHLYAEGTLAWQDRLLALADLRWRFGGDSP